MKKIRYTMMVGIVLLVSIASLQVVFGGSDEDIYTQATTPPPVDTPPPPPPRRVVDYTSGVRVDTLTDSLGLAFVLDVLPAIGTIKSVKNNCTNALFVPTKTATEYQTFLNYKPSCASRGAEIASYDPGNRDTPNEGQCAAGSIGDYEWALVPYGNPIAYYEGLICPVGYTPINVASVTNYNATATNYHKRDRTLVNGIPQNCRVNNSQIPNVQCGADCSNRVCSFGGTNKQTCNDLHVYFKCIEGR